MSILIATANGRSVLVQSLCSLRAHHVIAVVAILLISLGVKMFFFAAPTAEATIHAIPSAMNVLQMQRDVDTKSLPVQKMNDKTFIFTDEE